MKMKTNILITGATGNVGGKLVPTILRHMPEATITLLARGRSRSQAHDRAMRTIPKLTPDFDIGHAHDRLKTVRGDITLPDLGLGERAYDALAGEITHIIHSAAATKFRMPESEARATNYDGTRHLAEFGLRSVQLGGLSRFAYIGTAYACGNRGGRIPEAPFEAEPQFSNIYEQTKWEAERYLYRFRHDLPLDILRPSIIVGDSRTGIINDFNVLYAPLRLILTGRIRTLPCRSDAPLDVVPLDYVADVITDLVFSGEPRDGGIFHVVAGPGNEVTVGDVVGAAIKYVERNVPILSIDGIRYLPAAAAGARLARFASSGNRIMSIMREYLPYFTTVRHFDNANMRALRPGSASCPRFESYAGNLMRYFFDEDLGRRLRPAA